MKRLTTFALLLLIASPSAFALSARPRPTSKPTQSSASHTKPAKSATTTAKTATTTATVPSNQALLARVTVYWAKGGGKKGTEGPDRFTRKHQSAIGQPLHTGHCAVDPNKIPYGSKVVLPTGETLAAVDTGTAVKNRKAARLSGQTANEKNALVVDRFFETKKQALAWASTHPLFMPVRVVRPGSNIVRTEERTIMKAQPVAQPQRQPQTMVVAKAIPVTPDKKQSQVLVVANNKVSTRYANSLIKR